MNPKINEPYQTSPALWACADVHVFTDTDRYGTTHTCPLNNFDFFFSPWFYQRMPHLQFCLIKPQIGVNEQVIMEEARLARSDNAYSVLSAKHLMEHLYAFIYFENHRINCNMFLYIQLWVFQSKYPHCVQYGWLLCSFGSCFSSSSTQASFWGWYPVQEVY